MGLSLRRASGSQQEKRPPPPAANTLVAMLSSAEIACRSATLWFPPHSMPAMLNVIGLFPCSMYPPCAAHEFLPPDRLFSHSNSALDSFAVTAIMHVSTKVRAAGCALLIIRHSLVFDFSRGRAFEDMAERVGFEPTLEFPLNTLSKRAPSATRPSLRRRLGLESLYRLQDNAVGGSERVSRESK
jgi:hypothetical protein